MRNTYLTLLLLLPFSLLAQTNAVGIGTSNPQQKLHLDNSVGTLRVESLDKDNNPYNGGNANPGKTYPLYVDSDGVLTLKLQTLANSNGFDAIDHTAIAQSSVTLLQTDPDGAHQETVLSYTLTVDRPRILEIKYHLSFEVYQSNSLNIIRDGGARRISTYYTLDNLPRRYGHATKCYMNRNINNPAPFLSTDRIGAFGPFYNSSTTYIQLPAGTHTLRLNAEVSSNLNNPATPPSLATYVRFAVDNDAVFMRLY